MNILLETCEENCGPDKLVSVLAVASYLEIKDLILSTGDLMKDNIDETVRLHKIFWNINFKPLFVELHFILQRLQTVFAENGAQWNLPLVPDQFYVPLCGR